MLSRPTLKINVLGNNVVIRALLPSDFLDGDFPLCFFKITGLKVKTMAEQTRESVNMENFGQLGKPISDQELVNICKSVMKTGVVSINNRPFDIDEFINTETKPEKMLYITNEIIKISSQIIASTKCMTEPVLINKNTALSIDKMAKRYGKTPADIGLHYANEFDAYMFNLVICTAAINEEVSMVNSKKIPVHYSVN